MGNTASYVSAGKPKKTGAIFAAPKGTTLPVSTSEALDDAFKCLGYVSDAGVVNSTNIESQKIKAWGGDTVLVIYSSKEDTYKYTLIEVKNVDVLKFVYGADNVSGTLETGITVNVNADQPDEVSLVIDMIMSDNTAKRVVIPTAAISAVGDITYDDNSAAGYETTVDCIPDSDGNTHYEYIKKSGASA